MAIVMDITLHKPTWLESLVCEAPNGLVMLISLKFVLKVDPLKYTTAKNKIDIK